jgi:endonuclease G, mitochondrial
VNTPAELRVDPDYGNRGGYSANALGIEVPLPIADELADDLVTYGDGQTVLPYEHFSLVMSRSRRLAAYTAVNLDGERTVDTGPRKHDNWVLDKRLPDNVQIDSFLYDRTPFDKGHLVRRLDPVWGETRDEALRAEADTFHYTNCSPQHEKFNRSKELWQGIENYILDNTDLFHLRVCLFNGPVFALDDPTVKDVPIPREYWKVVTIRKADGSLSATAYLLSQAELLQEMLVPDFEFGAYRTFQVLVSDVEEKTRLSFGGLREHDPKRGAEGVLAVQPIELAEFSDIVL